jgi:hypothetical protein
MSLNADRCYQDAPEMDMLLANTVDGSGLVVAGGRVVKVPPEGPLHELVAQVARFLATQVSRQKDGRGDAVAVRCGLLASIIGTLADLQADAEVLPLFDSAP